MLRRKANWGLIVVAGLLHGCQTLMPALQAPAPAEMPSPLATSAPPTEPADIESDVADSDELLALPSLFPLPIEEEYAFVPAPLLPPESLSPPAEVEPRAIADAPIDDLWQLTRSHYGLDLETDDRRVKTQLDWYQRHPRYLDRVVERARRYYHYVLHAVIERGMPAEIALLPIVESAYDPFAYSHGRAAGPWQFIPGTAKHFGLKKSWWYDGRRDIQASTDAALDYLQQLAARFDGDYLLALASYNAGAGNVAKAIRYNRKRGRPTDFWSLTKLPRETSAYVPKLIALARLFKEPEAHGISLAPIPDEPYFAAVDIGSQLDLAQAADMARISIDELYLLNPAYNQWATDPEGPHRLLVPADTAETFRQALADLPAEKRVHWQRYKIRSGDSLITIAKHHNTTVKTLRVANNLRGNTIRAGQMLLIPTASADAKIYAYSAGQRQAKKNRRIALRSGKQKLSYRVRSGDSFWEIAQKFNVGVRELASWNQMAPGDPLRIGKQLVIWQAGPAKTRTGGGRNLVRKIGYRVRSGDSFARIASRFNLSINDIKRWNSQAASAKYLKPGQLLTLYVDITRAR